MTREIIRLYLPTIVPIRSGRFIQLFHSLLSYLVNRGIINHGDTHEEKSITFPFFLLGFLLMVILNSLQFSTPKAVKWIEFFDMFLLTMAMAGMGLEADFRKLLKVGFRPFLSIFATGFIAFTSLILIFWLVPL